MGSGFWQVLSPLVTKQHPEAETSLLSDVPFQKNAILVHFYCKMRVSYIKLAPN